MDEQRPANSPGELERSIVPERAPARHAPGGAGPGAGAAAAPLVEGYQVTARLGEGAMGTVWRAVQLSTRREVALKLMGLAHFGSERARQRFHREVELAARLQHPHIAAIYDSGLHVGVCFYAMELVDGLPLDRYVAENRLPRRAVLELMAAVCRAVAHAHRRGVIHRDLKPANILVDRQGAPHVLDFGLARGTAAEGGAAPTLDLGVAGTPAFMSPEQAAGDPDRVDTRSDVYSLGVILYRLLTGRSPHRSDGPLAGVLRDLVEADVLPPRRADPGMDRELEAVLLKALAREPDRRYPSADALAADIDNYLRGEPLAARPATTLYFLGRRLRRHRLRVGIAAAVLLAFALLASISYVRIGLARDDAVAARGLAERRARESVAVARAAQLRLADSLVAQGDAKGATGGWADAAVLYDRAGAVLDGIPAPRLLVDIALAQAYQYAPPPLAFLGDASRRPVSVAFAPDARTLAVGYEDGDVCVWDVVTGRRLARLPAHRAPAHCVRFYQGGGRLASAGEDKVIRLWDWRAGKEVRAIGCPSQLRDIAVSPDGRWLASGSMDRLPKLWDLGDGTERAVRGWDARPVDRVAFSNDSARLAYADWMGNLRVWDIAAGREEPFANCQREILALAFSPGGQLAAATFDGRVVVNRSGVGSRVLYSSECGAEALTFVDDDALVGAWPQEGVVRRLDLPGGAGRTLLAPTSFVRVAAVAPGASLAAGVDPDGRLAVWDLRPGAEVVRVRGHAGPVTAVALSDDGRLLATSATDKTLRLWDPATGAEVRRVPLTESLRVIAFSGDRRRLLTGGSGHVARLWDLESGRVLRELDTGTEEVSGVAFAPDGRRAAVGTDHWARLWDLESGDVVHAWNPDVTLAAGLAISADGTRGLCASVHGDALRGDMRDGSVLPLPTIEAGGRREVSSNVVTWGDLSEVIAGSGNTVVAWSSAGGQDVHHYRGHTGHVRAVAVTPDGRWLGSAGDDATVRLWDRPAGTEVRRFKLHSGVVERLAVRGDGRALVSASAEDLCAVDFTRPERHRQWAARLEAARAALAEGTAGPAALADLGGWYAFRGRWDWAAELLERARSGGGRPDPATLGRCYWKLGRSADAAREFRAALEGTGDAWERFCLRLCIEAVED